MARKKTGATNEVLVPQDSVVKLKPVSQKTMDRINRKGIGNQEGRHQYASISVTPPTYYNPLYTPTSLQLPRDRKQINVWARHFYGTEAIPNAAINLYASLPITNWTIECNNPIVKKYMEDMLHRLDFKKLLEGVALEYWVIGDVFIFHEPDEKNATWAKITVLNPDNVEVRMNPLTPTPEYELVLDNDIKKIVNNQEPKQSYQYLLTYAPEIVKAVKGNQNVKISPECVTHLKNQPIPYNPFGSSLLKSIFKTLMYYEMLRRAQFTIAERYFAPLKIFKLGTIDEPAGPEEIAQVQAMLENTITDPNLIMVATPRLQADWQGISGKTLNLANEYDFVERQMMYGLGISPAFIDASGPTYNSSSLGGTAFVQRLENFRDTLKNYVEQKVFKPICEWNDFTELNEETGETNLIDVKFKWDGLRLQDEASRQQALLALRQNGVMSAKSVLEAYHIDPEAESLNVLNERGSVFDAQMILARQIKLTQQMNYGIQMQYELMRQRLLGTDSDGPTSLEKPESFGSPAVLPGQQGSTPPPGGNATTYAPNIPGSATSLSNNRFASEENKNSDLKDLLSKIYEILAKDEPEDD